MIALVAGGSVPEAFRLGAAMFGLQAAIGALNDVVDAPHDAGRKPGKPIPSGLVSRRVAAGLATAAALLGLALSAPSGAATVVVALGILAIGALYDLHLKGTPLSWLPFAAGIPLLPVYAWLGATGTLPAWFAVLVPAAVLAGAGLAIANALVDVERDRAAGRTSVADWVGPHRAWAVHLALHAAVVATAAATVAVWARDPLIVVAVAGVPGLALAAGVALARSGSPARRERGWELEALAIAVLAGTWIVLGVPR